MLSIMASSFAAALGGAVESAFDMVGGNGDGAGQAVEVAVGGIDDTDVAIGNRRGRDLETRDVSGAPNGPRK